MDTAARFSAPVFASSKFHFSVSFSFFCSQKKEAKTRSRCWDFEKGQAPLLGPAEKMFAFCFFFIIFLSEKRTGVIACVDCGQRLQWAEGRQLCARKIICYANGEKRSLLSSNVTRRTMWCWEGGGGLKKEKKEKKVPTDRVLK